MTAVNKGIDLKLQDGSYMASMHATFLLITGIPEAATVAHIFPNLKYGSLLSVGQLCGYGCGCGCEAIFTKHTACITAERHGVYRYKVKLHWGA
jgi:hypothetical protein